ncbi:MAG TPA: hypothetical protein VHH09_05400 [Acidimicrobiales bacterium]|jgi:hypothetical protein|nr:hypothetical protein [Acidimicrobiales bacterium]
MGGHEQLATYLNDHLAGSEAGRDLAEKIASDNEGTDLGAFMSGVVTAIEEDRTTLEDIMRRAEVEKAFAKQAAGRLAEKLGRVRLHQRVTGDPGLSRVLELEALIMGVTGKHALWQTLRQVGRDDDRLAGVDFDSLIGRAEEQLRGLEEHHRAAAAEAF